MSIRWLYSHRILVALFVTAAAAVGLMAVLVIRQQQDQSNSQVYLEAGGSVGPNPFVPLMSSPAAAGGIPASAGSDNRVACDSEKLISHLTEDPQAGAAWVHALNSDRTLSWSGGSRIEVQQVPFYIRELKPRVVSEDLRVTNYQFTNGAALAVQSVLEKGTAILVDSKEIARVRCASGNPLAPMVQHKTPPVYRGKAWPSFQPQRVVAVQRGPQCGGGEYYDGARCQRLAACPTGEYRGDEGSCAGPSRPEPPDNGGRPDMQHWLYAPARQDEPGHRDKPASLDEPQHPGKPAPDIPQRSEESQRPNRSAPPVDPHHSDESRYSDKPAGQDDPQHSDESGHPNKPRRPDVPERSDKSQHPNTPARPDESRRSGEPQHSGKPAQPSKPRSPDQAGRPDQPVGTDKSGSPSKDKYPEKPNRSEKHARHDQSAKPDKTTIPDKTVKPERDEPSEPGDLPE